MISGHPGTCARLCLAYSCGGPPANVNTLGVDGIPLAGGAQCSHTVTYGCINIQSVNNKFDDVMDMFCSRQLRDTAQLTVLGLTETWHDTDCAAFGRFRDAEFSVVDRAHPRVRDDLSVNHGGVAIVAALGTSVSLLLVGCLPSTF